MQNDESGLSLVSRQAVGWKILDRWWYTACSVFFQFRAATAVGRFELQQLTNRLKEKYTRVSESRRLL